jgi:CRISPR-associated endonuclease/helicase Cas3
VSLPQFDDFFQAVTEKLSPYDYQRRLACGERNDRPEAEWLVGGSECNSQLINIPTGLGKTAAVTLAWLWNRVQLKIQCGHVVLFTACQCE